MMKLTFRVVKTEILTKSRNKSQRFPNIRSYLYPKKACVTTPETALHSGIIEKVHSPTIQLLYFVLIGGKDEPASYRQEAP